MTTDRLAPGGLAGVDVVIEATAPEAGPLAAFLAAEGAHTTIATPEQLDRGTAAEAAFLDAWTPEVSLRVGRLRAGGALVTCLADLVLARAGQRVVGVTGTAGKTTTTSLTAQLLRSAGVDLALPEPGLSGNLWPDASLLGALDAEGRIVMELTSSHLAFCRHSPAIAVVTSFWPDHVELHGSLEAYARAKEAIVRDQPTAGWLVVPDDAGCESFVLVTRAQVARFSRARAVERGAFVRGGRVVVRWDGEEHDVGAVATLPLRGAAAGNVLAACAAALAAGASPDAVAGALRSVRVPPHRFLQIGQAGGLPVYDDSMAGTPAKARAALELFPDASLVLVAGGDSRGAAGPVHDTDAERELLESACAVARRKSVRTILFGPAVERLRDLLDADEHAATIHEAIELAAAGAAGAEAVLIAPMFPVASEDRTRLASRMSPR